MLWAYIVDYEYVKHLNLNVEGFGNTQSMVQGRCWNWPCMRFMSSRKSIRKSKGYTAMIGIGIVGIGFMGMTHYLAAGRVAGAKVVAISTRDPKKRAGDWTSIQGNFGPRGTQMDLSGVAAYETFEELLADPKVNLVDLCVPNADHARLAIAALEAGKDVLVEKPIALSLEDAEAMVATARRTGRS